MVVILTEIILLNLYIKHVHYIASVRSNFIDMRATCCSILVIQLGR